MTSIGSSRGKGEQPSSHGSGSEEDAPGSMSNNRGLRRRERRRAMSIVGAEAVANGLTQQEFLAQAALVFDKARADNSSSAPSTIAAPPGSASGPSLPLSSLLPPTAVPVIGNSVSSLAAAAASQPQHAPLHGINARAAYRSGGSVDTKINTAALPFAPSIDNRSSGERERHRHRRSHHRQPSLSPSSSDDELTRGHHSLYYNGQRIKPQEQCHLSAIHSVRTRHASFTALFKAAKVTTVRNQFEGEELSAVLDQLLTSYDHINQQIEQGIRARTAISVAMKLATRRLEGIIKADTAGGDWSYASTLSLLKHGKLGNGDLDRCMLTDVTRTRTANKCNGRGNGGNDSSSSWRGRKQRGGGRGKGSDNANNSKSSSNDTNSGK